jgi:hypothetical protein
MRQIILMFLMVCAVGMGMGTASEHFPATIDSMTFVDVQAWDSVDSTAQASSSAQAATVETPVSTGVMQLSIDDDDLYTAILDNNTTYPIGCNFGVVLRSDRDYTDTVTVKLTDDPAGSADSLSRVMTAGEHGLTAGEWDILWLLPSLLDTTTGTPETWCTTINDSSWDMGRLLLTFDTRAVGGDPGALVIDVAGIVYQVPTKAKVIIMFDAAYDSQYTLGYPRMKSKGWRGVVPVISTYPDNANADYWSTVQLTTAYNQGWDIINKGYNHDAGGTGDAFAAMYQDLKTGRNWLVDNGFTRTADFMQYSSNIACSTTYDLGDYLENIGVYGRGRLGRTRYKGAAGTDYHDHENIVSTHSTIVPDDWLGTAYYSMVTDSQTDYAAGLDDIVEAAVFERGVLQLYCHEIEETPGAGNIGLAMFEALLADLAVYEAAGQLEVVTVSDWYNSVVGSGKYTESTSGGSSGATYQGLY